MRFRNVIVLQIFTLCLGLRSASLAQSVDLFESVDPFIGTSGGGNVFPGASLPFGMIQWSPDTNKQGFYDYEQKSIYGFSLTHLSGVGCPIFADMPVLPWSGPFEVSPGKNRDAYAVAFDHSTESAEPGYYAVTLAGGVRVELTVDERSGIARFSFPAGVPARLLLNSGGSADADVHLPFLPPVGREKDGSQVELNGNDSVSGTVTAGGFCGSATHYTLYMTAQFEQPYQSFAVWKDNDIHPGERTAIGSHTGAYLDFGRHREVLMRVGISYVSQANALDNLNREIPDWGFDRHRAKAKNAWTESLNKVEIVGGAPDQRKIFATGLYHSLLDPTVFSDENGDYTGFDWKVHSLAGTTQNAQYANFSDWDIYRNTVQLQALLVAGQESDMMQSLVNDAVESGWFPRWPAANESTYVMAGDSPVILLSSAYAFGAQSFDVKTALKYMVKAGSVPDRELPWGHRYNQTTERPHLEEYLRYGFVPVDDPISASRTLEYANADFAIARFAGALGDSTEYRHFLQQSENWRNLFDPETRWIRPRHADGSWLMGFDPDKSLPRQSNSSVSTDQVGFEEGNTYQYTFMIPFDYPELFRRIGSEAEVEARLDRFFSKLRCWGDPCFNMENEPDFVTPYAYVFAGMPWKAQDVITRIEKETFKTSPDGIPGNDDLGATSGVFVWNALGFYPAVPGIGGVALGVPMFHRATIHISDGRILNVLGEGSGTYVQSVTLNGVPYSSSWLPLSALKSGTSELVFKLAATPNKERGLAASDRPPSFTQ